MALSPAEFMMYSTTKLTGIKDGVKAGTGTGFYYRVKIGEDGYQFLVTNRHVVEGMTQIGFVAHIANERKEPSGALVGCVVNLHHSEILYHPEADLCAIPIGLHLQSMIDSGRELFCPTLTCKNIPPSEEWDSFDAIESATMVGCPNGLYDKVNALPISRTGNTASHPAKKYAGKDEFLVDLACFPGSSGSPIFLYDRGTRWNKDVGNFMSVGGYRFWLLGILYAGPTITTEGTIKMVKEPTFAVASMMHIGFAIRSTALLTIDQMLIEKMAKLGAAT
ncbi:MAG: serine protease [Mesorhizobium sp.]|nr:MAG: serine protease [Mesorhizobium sp.]